MMRMAPACSTTNSRFGSSGGAAMCVGELSPLAMRTASSSVPARAGTPAQRADAFSSWQVAEQPSPLTRLPSSHSSGGSASALPQVCAAPGSGNPMHQQSKSTWTVMAYLRPAAIRRLLSLAARGRRGARHSRLTRARLATPGAGATGPATVAPPAFRRCVFDAYACAAARCVLVMPTSAERRATTRSVIAAAAQRKDLVAAACEAT